MLDILTIDTLIFLYASVAFGIILTVVILIFNKLLSSKKPSSYIQSDIFTIFFLLSLAFVLLTAALNHITALQISSWYSWILVLVFLPLYIWNVLLINRQNHYLYVTIAIALGLLLLMFGFIITNVDSHLVVKQSFAILASLLLFGHGLLIFREKKHGIYTNPWLFRFLMLFMLAMIYDLLAVGFKLANYNLELWVIPFLLIAIASYISTHTFREMKINLKDRLDVLKYEFEEESENIEDVVIALARFIDAKDQYTEGHSERVSEYAVFLGERLGFDSNRLEALRIGALIHDIGKIGVDINILNKPGKLTDKEFAEIKKHPLIGEEICSPLKSLKSVIPIVKHHHEKLDGSGYPDGLNEDTIPIEARIVAIVDIFDALTTDRSYRQAMSFDQAIAIIHSDAKNGKLDAMLVDQFLSLLEEMYTA